MNRIVYTICFAVVAGAVLGAWATSRMQAEGHAHTGGSTLPLEEAAAGAHDHEGHAALEGAPKSVYVCPMNCVPPMEKPGACPVCGMEMVRSATGAHDHEGFPSRIVLSETAVAAAGIRTEPVVARFVDVVVRLYGTIEYDPVEQYQVTAFAPGVIDNIYVRRAGQAVRRGDPLFDLRSAELFYLEQELFDLLETLPYKLNLRPGVGHSRKRIGRWTRLLLPTKPGQENAMTEAEKTAFRKSLEEIKRKLRLLGLSEEDVEEAIVRGRPTGITAVTTPMTGIVLTQDAYRGAFVNTGDVVFTIANPRVLWARLDAYASDFPWIRLGQTATFEADAYPGQTFTGKVTYIDPEFDSAARVFKVGVLYRDDKGLLKPNMLVRAAIHTQMSAGGRGAAELVTQGMLGTAQTRRSDQPPLVIPNSAPLITGRRAVVYVAVPGETGVFEGREVVLGPRAEEYTLVWEGLEEGEEVVVNGNFKLDSAVQILAGASMMTHGRSEVPNDDYRHVASPAHHAENPAAGKHRGAQYRFHTGHGGDAP